MGISVSCEGVKTPVIMNDSSKTRPEAGRASLSIPFPVPLPVVHTETGVYCAAKPAPPTPMPRPSCRSAEVALP